MSDVAKGLLMLVFVFICGAVFSGSFFVNELSKKQLKNDYMEIQLTITQTSNKELRDMLDKIITELDYIEPRPVEVE